MVKRFRPVCQFLEDGTPVAVLCEFTEGYVSGSDYDALAARLVECEKFLEPTGWQKAQDEHNALKVRLAEAEALLRRGIVYAVNCEADPMQPVTFRKKAAEWREEVAAFGTRADQPSSASAQLAAAGYTKRDTRLQCDECGKWFTPQLLPAHQCAADQPSGGDK